MRVAVVSLFTLTVVGCVLFVEPVDVGDHCGIAGSGTCATCLRTGCQPKIDACCTNTACATSGILGELDSCAGGDTAACANTLASARILRDEELLRTCAQSTCKELCTNGATPDGGVAQRWTCGTPRDAANDCAQCIYDSCGSRLDSCCYDPSCANDYTAQTDFGTCLSGDMPGCAFIEKTHTTNMAAGGVRDCIAKKCASLCTGDGIPHQDCQGHGKYCVCQDALVSKGDQCSVASLGGGAGKCVLGLEGCQCGHYSCATLGTGGCTCTFNGSGGTDDTTKCALPTNAESAASCCLTVDLSGASCRCEDVFTPCLNRISNCDEGTVLTALAGRLVDHCSR